MLKMSVLALSLVAASTAAFADPIPAVLAPGATVSPVPGVNSTTVDNNPAVISTGNVEILTPTFDSVFTEVVRADATNPYCAGCLDFEFQVANIGRGSDASYTAAPIIERLTSSSFYGYSTSVSYTINGVAPTSASRSGDSAGVVGFMFGNPLTEGQVSTGLVIYTNALTYASGYVSIQDGTTGYAKGYVPGGTPYSPVPEPSSLLLLGSGLVGAASVGRRKIASFLSK